MRQEFTIWLTGLPSSGKSTLARLVEAKIRDRGFPVIVLDGDEVRTWLTLGLGFSRISFEGDSQTSVLYGGGVGIRERLRHGHGSVRIDRADSQESYSEPVNIIGVHVGFDLDLD